MVKSYISQYLGSILRPLFFLVYINDLPDDLESLAKLFADNTSPFSTVYDPLLSAETMNKDLIKVRKWAYQWKISFNSDITKEAQEVIFSRKSKRTGHPTVYFNHAPVARTNCDKHLGMYLDEKLNYLQHIKELSSKANRGFGVIQKLRHILPRHSLITIYKLFVGPHLDYGEIIYDQPNNESFCNKIERFQYNAALANTDAITETSQTKLYHKLGLKSLKFRIWMRRLCTFYKIKTLKLPECLYNLISNDHRTYNTRNLYSVET